MQKDELSKEAKERIKEKIDQDIIRYQEAYEKLSDEDKKALKIGRKAIIKEENSNKFLRFFKRIFKLY